jgi:hypothetical protein
MPGDRDLFLLRRALHLSARAAARRALGTTPGRYFKKAVEEDEEDFEEPALPGVR